MAQKNMNPMPSQKQVQTAVATRVSSGVLVSVAVMMIGAVCLAAAIATLPMKSKKVPYVCGDTNNSGVRNGLDVTYLVNFLNGRRNSGPNPVTKGDTNGDKVVNQKDVTTLVNFFRGKVKRLTCNQKAKVTVEICGDSNDDNMANGNDVVYLVNFLAGKNNGPKPLYKADVDGNGKVNNADVSYMVKRLQGGPAFKCSTSAQVVKNVCGDINNDGNVDVADPVYFADFLRGDNTGPSPVEKGDTNGDNTVNGLDVVYLVNYLNGGPALKCAASVVTSPTNTNTTTPTTNATTPTTNTNTVTVSNTNTSTNTSSTTNTNSAATTTNTNKAGANTNSPATSDAASQVVKVVSCGNINMLDGVDGNDVTYFVNWSKGQNTGPAEAWVADTNGDGTVSYADIQRMVNYLRGTEKLACNEKATLRQATCGDTNGDGTVNGNDVTYLVNYLNGGTVPFPVWVADVNGDQSVTSADSQYLADYFAGRNKTLNCTGSIR